MSIIKQIIQGKILKIYHCVLSFVSCALSQVYLQQKRSENALYDMHGASGHQVKTSKRFVHTLGSPWITSMRIYSKTLDCFFVI